MRRKSFRRLIAGLKAMGYEVEYRVLNSANFGAPTARKRMFVIARNDAQRRLVVQRLSRDRRRQPVVARIG